MNDKNICMFWRLSGFAEVFLEAIITVNVEKKMDLYCDLHLLHPLHNYIISLSEHDPYF